MFKLVLSNNFCLFCCFWAPGVGFWVGLIFLCVEKLFFFPCEYLRIEYISGLQQFAFCISSLQTENGDLGIVFKWWFLGLSLSLHHWEKPVCSSTLFSVFFCFLLKPLKLSVPGNNYMFPRGSPNIQGIRRHLACKSLFLSLTLCIAFYFSPLFYSRYPLCLPAVQTFNLIRWSHSFFPQPPHFPAHCFWWVFNLLRFTGRWCTVYSSVCVYFHCFFNFIKSARNASSLWEGRNLNIISVRFFTPRL